MGGVKLSDVLPRGATVAWAAESSDFGRLLGFCATVTLPGESVPIRFAVRVASNDADALAAANSAMAEWFADRLAKVAA